MNKHVNKVRKATGTAEAITAGRQQNKQQYLIIQLMKKKESIINFVEFYRLIYSDTPATVNYMCPGKSSPL